MGGCGTHGDIFGTRGDLVVCKPISMLSFDQAEQYCLFADYLIVSFHQIFVLCVYLYVCLKF